MSSSSSSSLSSSSSSYIENWSSSSSSSSSNFNYFDIDNTVLVAMASREYGEGRIFIHTDRVGGIQTGHNDNPRQFWRKIFEWVTTKKPYENIKVAVVINTKIHSADKIESFDPITVKKFSVSDLATLNLDDYDCLYFVGVPPSIATNLTDNIADYVSNGGGLIIECPNIGSQSINVLAGIEDLYCYSSERLCKNNAYWTIDGQASYVFYDDADIIFMSTLRMSDFSDEWTILMTNIEYVVTYSTTTPSAYGIQKIGNVGSQFGISFISAMQNGVVTLDTEEIGSSSSSSLSLSSSSSSSSIDSESSSSEIEYWNICDDIVAEWKMDDNANTPTIMDSQGNFNHMGILQNNSGYVNSTVKSVIGKVNGAISLDYVGGEAYYIQTPANTDLNFTNGVTDLPFSISLWIYFTQIALFSASYLIYKSGVWDLSLLDTGALRFIIYDKTSSMIYKGRKTPPSIITANQWHNVIIAYGGGTNKPAIYVDAVQKDTLDNNVGIYQTMINSDSVLRFSNPATNYFTGYIDQVIIVDKELNSTERKGLFNYGGGTENCGGYYSHFSTSSTSSISSSG